MITFDDKKNNSADLCSLHSGGVDNPSWKNPQSEGPGEHEYYKTEVTEVLKKIHVPVVQMF